MKWLNNYRLFVCLFVGFFLLYLTLIPDDAWAASFAHFFDPSQYGYDATNKNCSNIPSYYIIGSIVCQFIAIVDPVLVQVYDGIQSALKPAIQALLTLYIAVFGAQLLMGTVQMHPREIIIRLLKISGVWTFATNADYGVGVVFKFYMGLIADGGQAVVNALFSGQTIGGICQNFAKDSSGSSISATYPNFVTGTDPTNALPLFTFFDQLIYCAFVGNAASVSVATFGFFSALMVIYPPMFGVFIWWVKTTLFAIAETVLSFLTSLAAIAFLIALSPIFLSLMLFQVTNQFFNNWLSYLTAYSVQIIIVLGIVVLWLLMTLQFIAFFNDLGAMVMKYQTTITDGDKVVPVDTWGICDADYTNYTTTAPTCKVCKGQPNTACLAYVPPAPIPQCGTVKCASNPALATSDLIPPSSIIAQHDLIAYIFYHLVALLVLSYAFSVLLQNANNIAASIVGSAPTGGGGAALSTGLQSLFASKTNKKDG